jgi:uncharacterized protein YndB with AHSA1/START domain
MSSVTTGSNYNPKLDLVLERTANVSPAQVWKALTDSQELMKWFCPRPWKVVRAEIDARPGGVFMTEMQGPNGESPGAQSGCYLEVIPNKKLVWTSALGPDYRPNPPPQGDHGFQMTAVIELESHAGGTKYKATVKHADEKSRSVHDQMGFQQGWGAAFDQMVELIQSWK